MCLKLGLLHPTVSQVVNAKENLLKEIQSAAPVNKQIIRKWKSLIADRERVLVVWIEDQISHSIPLSQSLTQSKDLTVFSSKKAERGEEREKFEASRGWFMKIEAISVTLKYNMKWQVLMWKLQQVIWKT